MALLAETLVDEWLNRSGYFTIRGIKLGVNEIDLLGIQVNGGSVHAVHVECQVSFRPVGYICPLEKSIAKATGTGRSSARARDTQTLSTSVKAWVDSKYHRQSKVELRESLVPKAKWEFWLVHGTVKSNDELELIGRAGVKLVTFHEVLSELCRVHPKRLYSGFAGTDIAEIISYFQSS